VPTGTIASTYCTYGSPDVTGLPYFFILCSQYNFLPPYARNLIPKSFFFTPKAPMPHVNVEIKARCTNLETARERLQSRQPRFAGLDHQVDVYYQVPHGRLKLRRGNIENNLIYYKRPNQQGPKRSDVHLYAVQDGDELQALLDVALGRRVVVDKQREIYFVDNVKIHLDEVAGLGTFAEIEAIDQAGERSEADLLAQCQEFMELLGIREQHLVELSYSDLLLQQT